MPAFKINLKISVALLLIYTNDKQAEKEIRRTTPFPIVTNNVKYLRITLTKQVKDLYDKNFKSLKKEIEDIRTWNGHLTKKQSTGSMQSPSKSQHNSLWALREQFSTLYGKTKIENI